MSWISTLKPAARGPARKLSPNERVAVAKDLVQMSAFAAATVTYAPVPMVDFVAITPIQAAMVMAVGRVYGREMTFKEATHVLIELASVCGAGLVARQIWTTASKFLLPGLGGILAGPYTFAVTFAMGRTAMKYFEDPEAARGRLAKVFKDALAEGRRLFSADGLAAFRKKYGRKVSDFARRAGPKPARRGRQAKAAKPRRRR